MSVESIIDHQTGIVLSPIGEATPSHWQAKTWCERPEADEFAGALLSTGPHPDLPAEQLIFNPFIRSWDLLVTWYGEDGRATWHGRGEWHFAWVLGGRAVQDVWIVRRRAEGAGPDGLYEYGASLRFFDPALGAWRSTWFGPTQLAHGFLARRLGEDVVLESLPVSGRMLWVFSDITQEGFTWRNYWEADRGLTLTQDFRARRPNTTSPIR